MLEKTTTIMSISTKTRIGRLGTIAFDCDTGDPEDEVSSHEFFLDKSVWKDMGSPETITVTVVPGDTLNG